MAQCRNYLSISDCLSCFSSAASEIQTCRPSLNARMIYDGCYLRYQEYNFFNEGTGDGNAGFCGNRTASNGNDFSEVAEQLLKDLSAATPMVGGFFAAVKREGMGGAVVYGLAQCAVSVSKKGCGDCLNVAYGNIKSCLPVADGRAIDEGCFLRYSDTAFFGDNQTTDIDHFLRRGQRGGVRPKPASIGGAVGGVALILIIILFLSFGRLKRIRKIREETIGATELRGSLIFEYDDLKYATKNFIDKNKLGGGGFGDVYKGVMRDGRTVAVKKLMLSQSERVKEDFEKEVELINNVHHRNLVRLLGCCRKGPELLLVYEFMANNSLDKRKAWNPQLETKIRYNHRRSSWPRLSTRGIPYLHHTQRHQVLQYTS